MQVQFYQNVMKGQQGTARTQAMCFSANNKRLAIADATRHIQLFDEQGERRDKFATKAASDKGGRGYVVTGMAFSPDSSLLAIAQSDSIVFVYRLGLEWGEKKAIRNKLSQTSPVTCVAWPNTSSQGVELIAFATLDGGVKVGMLKANKSHVLYSHDHPAVSMCASRDNSKILTGHLDGTVYQYVFEASDDGAEVAGARRLFVHSCAPYMLAWGESICAAGADCQVAFYTPKSGQRPQVIPFDVKDVGGFTGGVCNPSGQAVAIAGREQVRIFDLNIRSRKWEEGAVVHLPHSEGFSAMQWKRDGSRLVTGSVTGSVDLFDCCLRRYRMRGAYEFTYVSHSQVIVKRLASGTRLVLQSYMGFEVLKVNVYQDRYLVAHTSATLLLGDLASHKLSEVPWQLTGREKFVFDNELLCMVFNVGELCLIEYGKNVILGTCRTEERNAHRISVRVFNPIVGGDAGGSVGGGAGGAAGGGAGGGAAGSSGGVGGQRREVNTTTGAAGTPITSTPVAGGPLGALGSVDNSRCVIAYLIDRQTIQIDDLKSGVSVARVAHESKIDWLELDFRASRLLFRDKQHQLYLYDVRTQQRTTLLSYCTYVQWVPRSDVVVAQSRLELCVWYNVESPDRVTIVPIRGEVEGIERSNGKTEVIVDEGVSTVAYALDESLIEFRAAMEERDLDRACDLLERTALTPGTEAMWSTLAEVSLQEMKLFIAERCYAALGDVAKVNALQRIHELAAKARADSAGATTGYDHYTVLAELYMMNCDFKRAEQLYLENSRIEDAMRMWEEMNRFDESLSIAESRGLDDVANRRARYFAWLMETRQYERAGEMREKDGKYIDAINLYLRGGTPARAAHAVSVNNLKPEQQLLEAIAAALFRAQVFEAAGDFFDRLHMTERAIDAYKRGHAFSRAVEYAKVAAPQQVVALEEAWGDYLVSQKHVDQAINHYSEAGVYGKAVKAALDSRQWAKAAALLEAQSGGSGATAGSPATATATAAAAAPVDAATKSAYQRIARHYEEVRQFAEAERYHIKSGAVGDAVDMYSRAGMTDHMYRVAQRHLEQDKLIELFVSQAKQLETKGDYAAAERIYLKVNDADGAIMMYRKNRDYTNMMRLVQAYRSGYVVQTHLALAAQFQKEGNLKLAETHFIAGKDWSRAVSMYRDRDLWDDAVRVAKVHGGANAAKQVVVSRATVMDGEEGVRLLGKFNLVEAGIDAALESSKFDLALQWAQLAQPAKVPYVYLKYAMHYEDQGDFRMAEDAFIKSGKPREAIDMYVHQHDFTGAMRVAENHDASAVPHVCAANGRVCFQQGNYKEAESLFLRANAPETLLRMYVDTKMFPEAQRVAKEHCPEMQSDVAKRMALNSNDPQKAGAVLEENNEYQLAIDTYLAATPDTVSDSSTLANLWVRAVKVAQKHVRNTLKEVLRTATDKLKAAQRYVEAGKCLEDCEDYRAAINMYVQAHKFDMAETLAKRVSPELEDYVKRAIVQDSISGGSMKDAKVVEEMDPEAALKAYISKADFANALRMAGQRSQEELRYVAGLQVQHLLRQGDPMQCLEALSKNSMDPDDFRFYETWMSLAQKVIPLLPGDEDNGGGNALAALLPPLHDGLVRVQDSMTQSGQKSEDIAKATALATVVHIYYMSRRMEVELNMPEFAVQLMLGLPRWIPHVAPDKAFYDAGMAAKRSGVAGMQDAAFLYLNRALDITERIEDGDVDSSGIANDHFAATDFPPVYRLPKESTVPAQAMEEVNNWVLTVSIDNTAASEARTLPMVPDPETGAPMFAGAVKSPHSGKVFPTCAVTGYPVMGGGLTKCTHCQRPANQADWNRYVLAAKRCPWCGAPANPNFKS
ncbi:intraflagellar transport protein 172 [Novymonas esmeraldas]|uniref:Intraflagellar transport protein 172 n=1 Tax=Novymonas esmeraldas TaxID=1808958 RepID=A0AAW0EL80_9TRYP